MSGMDQKHTNSTRGKADVQGETGAQSVSESTPLLWITVLSLDAPAVAVLWQLLFAHSFRVQLGWSVTVLLALVVWFFTNSLSTPVGRWCRYQLTRRCEIY